MKPLDMRDIAIIDSFPVHDCQKKVLNVGCGEGRIDYHLADMGYKVYATDISMPVGVITCIDNNPSFQHSDIFDLSSFPIKSSPIVICSQVLEHLSGWRIALVNLMALAEIRIIITIPYKKSFWSPEHVNFFDDNNVHEFTKICSPYSTAISRILTKPEDKMLNQSAYLITINKRQALK